MSTANTITPGIPLPPEHPADPLPAPIFTAPPRPGAPDPRSNTRAELENGPADEPLAGSMTWLLLLTAGQKVLGFVRSVLVCRWLDPFQVGLWGMAQAAMDTTVPLLLLSIPGSFGRYMEYYRQRGQLRTFLRWTIVSCLLTFGLGLGFCYGLRDQLATLVFGDVSFRGLTGMGLVAVVPAAGFAIAVEFLLGARQGKTVSLGHFVRGTLFTAACLLFLLVWRRDAAALVTAYGLSFLIALLWLIRPIGRILRCYPPDTAPLAWRAALQRIGPAVVGCWAMDFLNNLFLTVDRYMLLHWSRLPNEQTLAAIGNYEAALVFPLLLATVAFMAARMILPHLAKDWEMGNQARVTDAMNAAVQLAAIVLTAGGWLLTILGPQIFTYALRGQFPDGRAVLPVAVVFYIWMALTWVVMNFLWCVERTAWGVLAMIAGLVTNIALNAAWVPTAGIAGAAQATLAANAVQLALLLGMTRLHGMPWKLTTIACCVLPYGLIHGTGVAGMGVILSLPLGARAAARIGKV